MLGPGVGERTTEGDILRSLIGRLHRGNWTHKNREGRKRADQARMAGASSHCSKCLLPPPTTNKRTLRLF